MKYYYIGSVECSGKLNDGKPWRGTRICCASYRDGKPNQVKIFKVINDSDILDTVADLEPGQDVSLSFDELGRVIDIKW